MEEHDPFSITADGITGALIDAGLAPSESVAKALLVVGARLFAEQQRRFHPLHLGFEMATAQLGALQVEVLVTWKRR